MDDGLILGRYRLLAEIGEGGHGEVDLAFDTRMARRVAIKRIPVSRRGIELLRRTAGLKEARTAALLNHPGIVTVHEWDTDEDEAFLIMEHVDGASLAELLEAYAPLDADEAAAVLRPVADALAFAHDNGVLHLDLKPENVLVTRDGLVKVADFGVASLTNAAGQAISAGGTLGYMPPEQLRGEPVDTRTDVWAFAALAFEVLTGAVPMAADSVEGALFKAERTGVPAPSEFEPSLPAAVDDILMEALAPDPDERPGEVATLAAELLATLGDDAAGRDGLRELVAELTAEDDVEEEPSLVRLGLWDRLARGSGTAERAVCAIASAMTAFTGMDALGFGWAAAVAVVAIAGAAGWFAPRLGLAAGAVVLAAGGFAVSPATGTGLAILGALWWLAVARTRPAAAAVPAFAPLAGVLGLGAALPLAAGFFLDGVLAAGAAGAGAGAVLVAASLAGGATRHPLTSVDPQVLPGLLTAPAVEVAPIGSWVGPAAVVVAGWAIAAMLVSLGARTGRRLGAAAGASGGLLVCAASLGPWVTASSRPAPGTLLQLALALILMVVVIALGPPLPADDDTEDGS